MPYKNDLRRTVTINLPPDEYAWLADEALAAGYATPGTYAKALVRARGDVPTPILDQRSAERCAKLEGQNEWLLLQYEHLRDALRAAGLPVELQATPRHPGPAPLSWGAQERARAAAVEAVEQRSAAHIRRLEQLLATERQLSAALRRELAQARAAGPSTPRAGEGDE